MKLTNEGNACIRLKRLTILSGDVVIYMSVNR